MTPTKLAAASQIPRPGMFAIVRNRRGMVAAVEPSDDARHGRLHLVHLAHGHAAEATTPKRPA